jgi:anti-anti-sigma factor
MATSEAGTRQPIPRPGAIAQAGANGSPAPRFSGRRYRSRGWPCPRPSEFAILVVHARDDILLQLSGRLHSQAAQAFDDCVVAAVAEDPRHLVVDCSGLEAMERECVRCFVRARQRADDAGLAFVLDAPNTAVRGVLRESAVDETFSVR